MKLLKPLPLIAMVAVLCWLSGCVVPSIYPLFESPDFILEPALAGKWEKMADGRRSQETLEFKADQDEKTYRVLNVDRNGKQAKLMIILGKIDGKEYLCGTLDPESLPETTTWFVSMPPHFLIFRVEQIQPELRLIPLDYEAVANLLKEHPEAVSHVKINEKKKGDDQKGEQVPIFLLTAPPAEFQKFIKDYAEKAKLFNPRTTIVMVPPEEAARRDAIRQAEEAKAAAAEVAQRLAMRIKKYDLDGDGKLNADEEKRAIEQEKAEQLRAAEQAKKQILAPPQDE